jgi:hypothetical protein
MGGCEEREEAMPRYTAIIGMTLKITTETRIEAPDEATAHQQVFRLLAQTHFGTLAWEVKDAGIPQVAWEEEEADTFLDGLEEA